MTTAAIIETIRSELSAALPRWGMSTDATLAFLSHSENTTFLAEDPLAGQRLVLRVQRIGYHSPAEIVSELSWIAALITDEVIVTPRPRPDRDGQWLCSVALNGSTRQVVAFEHMSGHEPDATASLPAWFLKLGALTARLHGHSRSWKRTSAFLRKTWDFDAMLGARPLWGDWRAGLGLRDPEKQLLQRVADALAQRVHTYGQPSHRFGLVHADLRLANLLVDGTRLGAWLEGYRQVAPVSKADEAMLPVFVMLRRMLLTAWIASHSDTETARRLGTEYTEGTVAMGERFLGEF
jgi:Ser/Thr protein kinase RdoA (MazF antagonist)